MKHDPRDYEIRIQYSAAAADECFIARVVEWPEVSAHGSTREQAVHEIQEALELAISAAEDWGHPIPEPRFAHA